MKIMVGMSGGVDSSVAALLLKRQGHDIIGVFMKNWDDEDDSGLCTDAYDYDDVRRTCDAIGVPYFSVNFTEAYKNKVFDTFLREYKEGRTPNPDVLCNTEIKFNAFLDFAASADCDLMATGHYVRTDTADGKIRLLRGVDKNKDQSYFLCGLDQKQLAKSVFPIGNLTKNEVRDIARHANLPTADKKESMGICFIGERKFREFIAKYIPANPGDMRDIDSGRSMGVHEGLSRYTIGQRKGIGIGGVGTGEPWFVARKDAAANILYICQGRDNPALYFDGLTADKFNWISGSAPAREFRCTAKFRYRQKDAYATAVVSGETVSLRFDEKQRAVTQGQYAVLYDEEVCLGGGIIVSDHQ